MADRSAQRVALAAALVCLLLTTLRANPPSPRQPVSDGSFAADSALQVLESLYSGVGIHPIGTENNRLLKERILQHLRDLGYQPSVQSTMACWESGGCGQVENILARLEGTGPGKAVLLAVHYDGVGAGPSVSDDGVAVAAVLEIARILASGPPLANDVIFLIDDGEEAFLLGAVAFAAKHPWARDVGAVVNLEARGTAGKSFLFETGKDNSWLVQLMKQNLPLPATSSLFYSIYQRLPNDTDFTVFKHYGMNGVNFAFIQNVVHYHTPLDDLEHASPATLQHHGDNALGMVRALANADLVSPPTGTASWFDVWGFGIVTWPEPWNLPLSIFSLALIATTCGLQMRRGALTARQLRGGLTQFPLALVVAVCLAFLSAWMFRSVGRMPDWPAVAWPVKAVFWLIGVATSGLTATWMGRRSGGLGAWLGAITWLSGLATLVSLVLPGAAYLFLVPALVGGVLSAISALWQARGIRLAAVGSTILAAGAVQLVLAWSLWDAMGISIMPLVAGFVAAISALVLAPAAETLPGIGGKISGAGLGLAALLVAVAMVLPAYSAESPRALDFYFVQDTDSGRARIAVRPEPRPLPTPLARAANWNQELENFYPWNRSEPTYLTVDLEPLSVAPPVIEVLQTEKTSAGRRVRARLSSPRGADRGALVFSETERIESLHLAGWDFDLQTEEIRAWYPDGKRVVRFATMPSTGIEFELALKGDGPFTLYAVDTSYGLPAHADFLPQARPVNVVPIHRGDLTILHSKSEL